MALPITRRALAKLLSASAGAAAIPAFGSGVQARAKTAEEGTDRSFPQGFLWGSATASYQVEGAVNEEGRGVSIWDTFSQTAGKTHNGDTGAVADDHFHLFKTDIALMKALGVKSYRFSVSWPRVFPDGTGTPNPKGLDFYNRMLDDLLSSDIKPFCTLYHWDLPQKLQDKGGWQSRDTAQCLCRIRGLHRRQTIGSRQPFHDHE